MFHYLSLNCFTVLIWNCQKFSSAERYFTIKTSPQYLTETYSKLCPKNISIPQGNLTDTQKELLPQYTWLLRDSDIKPEDFQISDLKKFKKFADHIQYIEGKHDMFMKFFINQDSNSWLYMKTMNESNDNKLRLEKSVDYVKNVFGDDFWPRDIINHNAKGTGGSPSICSDNQSLQQVLIKFYSMLSIVYIKGLLVILYFYCTQDMIQKGPNFGQNEIDKYRTTVANLSRIEDLTRNLSREVKRCDNAQFRNGQRYSQLGPVFQAYYIYKNRPWKDILSSSSTCESIKKQTIQCTNERCKNQPQICGGRLRDCQSIDNDMEFCIAPSESDRRYDWMQTSTGAVYGHYRTPDCSDIRSAKGSRWTDVCLCNCESENIHIARYFSLQNVTSDVDQNKVVTGVRLTKKESVFHIQIQQGTLGAEGYVKKNSVEWKEIESIPFMNNTRLDSLSYILNRNNLYPVKHDTNTVYLDDFDSQEDKLVTGVRFQRVGDDLRLEIQETPFNFTTGQLDGRASAWRTQANTTDERTEVKLANPDEPTRATGVSGIESISQGNQFVRFKMTDLAKDLGQHTVPYIDLREVYTNPPTALSGIGLLHRGHEGSGGFLALKIIQYNFANHPWF